MGKEESGNKSEQDKENRLGYTRRDQIRLVSLYAGLVAFTVLLFISATIIGFKYLIIGTMTIYAYILGLQHALDADHIACIDSTTRKLTTQNEKPMTCGMWFALGHSTIVVGLTAALIIAAKAVMGVVPGLMSGGNLWGTGISGVFLFFIGLLNLFIVRDVYKTFKKARLGTISGEELDEECNKNNVTGRLAGRLFNSLTHPWQIYPIGVLFGLGFDTATQIALLVAAVAVSATVPTIVVLVMPLLFTAGMVTVNSTMGVLMRSAYGWATMKPIRKVFFSLTITVISVVIAFAIGGIELLQVLGMELGSKAGFFAFLVDMNFGNVGYVIITIFLTSWVVALLVYRHKKYEQKGFKVETPKAGGAPISAPVPVIEAAKTTVETLQNAGKRLKTVENAGENRENRII